MDHKSFSLELQKTKEVHEIGVGGSIPRLFLSNKIIAPYTLVYKVVVDICKS